MTLTIQASEQCRALGGFVTITQECHLDYLTYVMANPGVRVEMLSAAVVCATCDVEKAVQAHKYNPRGRMKRYIVMFYYAWAPENNDFPPTSGRCIDGWLKVEAIDELDAGIMAQEAFRYDHGATPTITDIHEAKGDDGIDTGYVFSDGLNL